MKILDLQFLAFGPFTNLCLDLSAGNHGLHVLFGPNEAGKSSALRALRALLYGIPSQTADNFLHDNPKLRLGGRLRHSDGTELQVVRRKGVKNTLLGPDERPIPDSALSKFLAGVGQELFSTMFGLDHPALRRGGEEILQGGGEVGQSLFSAALGGVSLRHIQQNLDNEARQLFLPQGQNPRVNKALAEYRAIKRMVEEYSLAGGRWAEHTRALDDAFAERQKVLEELARLSKEKHRLERLQAAIPKLARRTELLGRRQEFRDVVLLPADFAEQRREAVQQIERAREDERASNHALEQLSAERHALIVPAVLLEQAEAVTLLQQRLGSYRKAAQDRSRLLGQGRQLEVDVQSLLARLPSSLTLERVKAHRLQAAHRARVQELARQYQAHVERLDRATRDVQKYAEQRTKTSEALNALAAPRDTSELRRAVLQARQQGDLEETCAQVRTALQMEEEQAQVEIAQLGCWSGTVDELERLLLPDRDTVDQFEAAFSQLNADARHLDAETQKTQAELAECGRQLDALQRAGTVPSEEELEQARQHRNELWQRVRQAWLDGEAMNQAAEARETSQAIAAAYTDSVDQADEVADRLRREAERVTRQATLLAQREKLAQTLHQLATHRNTVETGLRLQQQQWCGLWQVAGIVPLSPRAMRTWLDRYGTLLQRASRVREFRHQLTRLQQHIFAHGTAIRLALERLGECGVASDTMLNAVLAHSEAIIEAIEDAARQRHELQKQLATGERELEGARRDQHEAAGLLSRWQTDWAAAVMNLGLDSTALPVEAHAVLDVLNELLMKQDEADRIAQRIEGIDHDAHVFAQAVTQLVAQVAPDLVAAPAEQAAIQLQARLARAQSDEARKAVLNRQTASQEATLQTAKSTIERMSARLHALCRQAGCTDPDELAAAEARSSQLLQLQTELAALDGQILEQGAGATLDQLMQEAEALDADTLPAQLADLTRQLHELEHQRSNLDQSIGREQEILKQMDGSAMAAEAAGRAQASLAELRQGVERYVRLRLASIVLRREIERYRVSHQGPLLGRASALFTRLTLGAFTRLETDYNEKDQPVLVGVRSDGTSVRVEGMSDGTRDQLYLALRLSSLERYLASHEPLPFIVDDILIQFDDQRAKAALHILLELSRQTQVIFFTHHWRLAELAQDLDDHTVVQIQQLKA
jgi:uncharacterized protein YhaN